MFYDKLQALFSRNFIRKVIYETLAARIFGPSYLAWTSRGVTLPPYTLAIFDGDGDGGGDGGNGGAGGGDGGGSDGKGGGDGKGGSGEPAGGKGADGKGGGKGGDGGNDGGRQRGGDGRFVDRDQLERDQEFERLQQHAKDLGKENAERRREAKEVKGENEVLRNRAIRDDASAALTEAGALSKRVVDMFLADHTDNDGKSTITLDKKTGRTVGLEKIAEWKKANPELFKPDEYNEAGFNKDGFTKEGFNKDGFDKDGYNKDGKDKDGKEKPADGGRGTRNNGQRPNRTSAGAANGAGAGTEGDDGGRQGLPDLSKCKDAAERAQVMRDWKRSLRGSSTGFGKASSRH